MKINIFVLTCATLTACVNVETIKKNGQELANQLEEKRDVIETIKQYKTYRDGCDSKRTKCMAGDALAKEGTDFGCIDSWRDEDYYNSDNCILLRRNLPESDIAYFDYERFLPKGSKVKTDGEFLSLIKYYNTTSKCYETKETTTKEKQDCYDKIIDTTREMAISGVKCSVVYKDKYAELLEEKGQWYKWAIDHDPYEKRRLMYALGYAFEASLMPAEQVYSRAEALKSVKADIVDFGKEYGCDITGWKEDIRKKGYNL